MSDKTSIEWTATANADGTVTPGASWNPVRGCTKIAQGCKNCYAETFAERFRGVPGHPYERGFDPRTVPGKLTEPLTWKKPRRIFVNSMSDLFHEAFDFEYIAAVFGVMNAARQHTFQILTKRSRRAVEFFAWLATQTGYKAQHVASVHYGEFLCKEPKGARGSEAASVEALAADAFLRRELVTLNQRSPIGVHDKPWPLPNVWIGTSISTQADADANTPHLLQIPAAVRFLSVEPLIGAVTFRWASWEDYTPHPRRKTQLPSVERGGRTLAGCADRLDGLRMLDWLIVGGESGPGSRPCDVEWIRSIVAECAEAGVPCFVKQVQVFKCGRCGNCWTEPPEWPAEECGDDCPSRVRRVISHSPDEWPDDLRVRQFPAVQR